MPYAKRKPGAGPVPPVRHPDDEYGFSWAPDAADELMDAADGLQNRNDPRPLVRALLRRGRLPRPARAAFWLWLGEPPPAPPELSPEDQAMLEAVIAYERMPFRRNAEGVRKEAKWGKAKRVLDAQPLWRERGITEERLVQVANGEGRLGELISNYRDYHDLISLFPDGEPPKRSKS
jgi:hypothetical protein